MEVIRFDGYTEGEKVAIARGQSARIALTYVKSHASELGLDEGARHAQGRAECGQHHGHGDGVAAVRAAREEPVGMTGEVALHGRVLPIGGLKQKVLAAHAAGLRSGSRTRSNFGAAANSSGSLRRPEPWKLREHPR